MKWFAVKFRGHPAQVVRFRRLRRILGHLKAGQRVTVQALPPPDHLTTGYKIVVCARRFRGVHEQPAGSNSGPLITGWLADAGYPVPGPWCAAFACAVVKLATGRPITGGSSASVQVLRIRAVQAGTWHAAGTISPAIGWLAVVEGDRHIMIVSGAWGAKRPNISGNTSSADGTNYNGGEVAEHSDTTSSVSGYIDTTSSQNERPTP